MQRLCEPIAETSLPAPAQARNRVIKEHFDRIAPEYDAWKQKNFYYFDTIKNYVRRHVQPGHKVLEIGCATGEMLAAVEPSRGVGIDISPNLIGLAAKKFPQYEFICSSVEDYDTSQKFDYILMIDFILCVYDVMAVLEKVRRWSHPSTRIIIITINPLWSPVLTFAEKLKAKMPDIPLNFFDRKYLNTIIENMDFTIACTGHMLLFPKRIPLLSSLANTLGVRTWGIKNLSAVQYMTIQPGAPNTTDLGYGCSVVIPCHNEADNIEEAVRRVPPMGKQTEIIVVNDGSTDDTAAKIRKLQEEFKNLRLIDYSPNKGKGHAVAEGFNAATEEVLIILDADMAVPPEELPRFFVPLNNASAQFVNGTRMIYPMENDAMRYLNFWGNKMFGGLMTFLTGQPMTDTLCGTKAFYKKDYPYMQLGVDKWGDFDLLFGAAKLGNKIVEIPVHYMARRSGKSKMKSFKHGMHLLKACVRGFRELVFVRE